MVKSQYVVKLVCVKPSSQLTLFFTINQANHSPLLKQKLTSMKSVRAFSKAQTTRVYQKCRLYLPLMATVIFSMTKRTRNNQKLKLRLINFQAIQSYGTSIVHGKVIKPSTCQLLPKTITMMAVVSRHVITNFKLLTKPQKQWLKVKTVLYW